MRSSSRTSWLAPPQKASRTRVSSAPRLPVRAPRHVAPPLLLLCLSPPTSVHIHADVSKKTHLPNTHRDMCTTSRSELIQDNTFRTALFKITRSEQHIQNNTFGTTLFTICLSFIHYQHLHIHAHNSTTPVCSGHTHTSQRSRLACSHTLTSFPPTFTPAPPHTTHRTPVDVGADRRVLHDDVHAHLAAAGGGAGDDRRGVLVS